MTFAYNKEMSLWYSENATDLRKPAVGITKVLFPHWPGFYSYIDNNILQLENI